MTRNLYEEFPVQRIKAIDGMAVTAEVWDEAHDYHRERLRLHERLWHGAGLVAGLEVVASDPPDSSVYVLPGVALDGQGRAIVLSEPVAYDLGAAHGTLYLVLSYDESRPIVGRGEDAPLHVQAQFGLEVTAAPPPAHSVELARLRRRDRGSALSNARDPEQPQPNEIDLRFRLEVVARPPTLVSVGVSYAGGDGQAPAPGSAAAGHGLRRLAEALRGAGTWQVCVDDGVPLGPGLEGYDLLCLVGRAAFQLGRDEMNALYAYLKAGGTVFMESCRHDVPAGDPPADACFLDLLASLGVQLQEPSRDHPLLVRPNLFATPPPGFETRDGGRVLDGEGVILSTRDYGCLWGGERRGQAATREEIRSAMEWGANLIAHALARREALRAPADSAARTPA